MDDLATVRARAGRTIVRHAFASAFVLAVLVGGGLRLLPTSTANAAGSGAAGGSTACSAPSK